MAVEGTYGMRLPSDFRVTTNRVACKAETEYLVNFAGTQDRKFIF